MLKQIVKNGVLGLMAVTLALGCAKKDANLAATAAPTGSVNMNDKMDKVSYAIGYSTGQGMSQQGLKVKTDAFMKGMQDGLNPDQKGQMTEKDMQETLDKFRVEFMEQRKKELFEAGEKNKQEGAKFLEENKKKEGVITTASGLQYKVVKAGTGAKPKAEDSVKVKYSGKLLNGKEFDSSEKQGGEATFQVNRTIKGMSEALQLMSPGSKFTLWIPADLAYGSENVGPIGPNSALVFDVELVSIDQPKAEAVKPAPQMKK